MTMTPVPGTDGQFLSTHEFFSPNDSLNARIVLVTRKEKNVWERKTICYAPFVHRFGILKRGGVNYIIVCCLKTGHVDFDAVVKKAWELGIRRFVTEMWYVGQDSWKEDIKFANRSMSAVIDKYANA